MHALGGNRHLGGGGGGGGVSPSVLVATRGEFHTLCAHIAASCHNGRACKQTVWLLGVSEEYRKGMHDK